MTTLPSSTLCLIDTFLDYRNELMLLASFNYKSRDNHPFHKTKRIIQSQPAQSTSLNNLNDIVASSARNNALDQAIADENNHNIAKMIKLGLQSLQKGWSPSTAVHYEAQTPITLITNSLKSAQISHQSTEKDNKYTITQPIMDSHQILFIMHLQLSIQHWLRLSKIKKNMYMSSVTHQSNSLSNEQPTQREIQQIIRKILNKMKSILNGMSNTTNSNSLNYYQIYRSLLIIVVHYYAARLGKQTVIMGSKAQSTNLSGSTMKTIQGRLMASLTFLIEFLPLIDGLPDEYNSRDENNSLKAHVVSQTSVNLQFRTIPLSLSISMLPLVIFYQHAKLLVVEHLTNQKVKELVCKIGQLLKGNSDRKPNQMASKSNQNHKGSTAIPNLNPNTARTLRIDKQNRVVFFTSQTKSNNELHASILVETESIFRVLLGLMAPITTQEETSNPKSIVNQAEDRQGQAYEAPDHDLKELLTNSHNDQNPCGFLCCNLEEVLMRLQQVTRNIARVKVASIVTVIGLKLNLPSLSEQFTMDLHDSPLHSDIHQTVQLCFKLYHKMDFAKLEQLLQVVISSPVTKHMPERQLLIAMCSIISGLYLQNQQLGLVYAKLNHHENRKFILRQETLLQHVGFAYFNLARHQPELLARRQGLLKALDYLSQSYRINSRNYIVTYTISQIYLQLYDYEQAQKYITQCCRSGRGGWMPFCLLACVFCCQRLFKRAEVINEELLLKYENVPLLYYVRAYLEVNKLLMEVELSDEIESARQISESLYQPNRQRLIKSKSLLPLLSACQSYYQLSLGQTKTAFAQGFFQSLTSNQGSALENGPSQSNWMPMNSQLGPIAIEASLQPEEQERILLQIVQLLLHLEALSLVETILDKLVSSGRCYYLAYYYVRDHLWNILVRQAEQFYKCTLKLFDAFDSFQYNLLSVASSMSTVTTKLVREHNMRRYYCIIHNTHRLTFDQQLCPQTQAEQSITMKQPENKLIHQNSVLRRQNYQDDLLDGLKLDSWSYKKLNPLGVACCLKKCISIEAMNYQYSYYQEAVPKMIIQSERNNHFEQLNKSSALQELLQPRIFSS